MKIEVVNNKDYWDLPKIHSFTITLIPENDKERDWVHEDGYIEEYPTDKGNFNLIISGKVSSIVMKEEK